MLKLEIDEKFEELSYLYDLFENITRNLFNFMED